MDSLLTLCVSFVCDEIVRRPRKLDGLPDELLQKIIIRLRYEIIKWLYAHPSLLRTMRRLDDSTLTCCLTPALRDLTVGLVLVSSRNNLVTYPLSKITWRGKNPDDVTSG